MSAAASSLPASPYADLDVLPFFLFGMGPKRPKLVYRNAGLLDALTGATVRNWQQEAADHRIEPSECRVSLLGDDGGTIARVWEDAAGLWVEEAGRQREPLSESPIPSLPRFDGHPHAALLRTLHHEMLVNLTGPDGAPVPNLFVYDRP